MSDLHEEVYRGISFHRTHTGFWIFDSYLPDVALRWGHWSRFFTNEEIDRLEDKAIALSDGVRIMHLAVDRALSNSPCFTGDIRLQ